MYQFVAEGLIRIPQHHLGICCSFLLLPWQHLQRSPPSQPSPCPPRTSKGDFSILKMTNLSRFLQVTTPFILSVCLADFLFAIVLLPTQATRWQLNTFKTLFSFLFQIHVKGLGGWGWPWERNDLPSVSNHPIYCTGYHFKWVSSIGGQYQHALFPQEQHSNPNDQNGHRWHCKGCLCAELDVHHLEPGCRSLLWWHESYPEVGHLNMINLMIIDHDMMIVITC